MTEEEREFRASLAAEPGLFVQIGALFAGPIGRLAILVYAFAIAVFALGIWTLLQMLDAREPRVMLLWLAATAACWTTVLMIKLWIWSRLNTLAVLRALHRR